jgi:hypothetical protein
VDDVQRPARAVDQGVSVVESRARRGDHLRRELDGRQLLRAPALLDHRGQVVARQVLHGQVVLGLRLAEVVDVGDVGMVQARGDPRLVQEDLDELVYLAQLGEDPLEHHHLLHPARSTLHRQVDLRHAPAGEPAQDAVAPEGGERL